MCYTKWTKRPRSYLPLYILVNRRSSHLNLHPPPGVVLTLSSKYESASLCNSCQTTIRFFFFSQVYPLYSKFTRCSIFVLQRNSISPGEREKYSRPRSTPDSQHHEHNMHMKKMKKEQDKDLGHVNITNDFFTNSNLFTNFTNFFFFFSSNSSTIF